MVNIHSAVAARINRRRKTPPIFRTGLTESNQSPLALPSYRWDLDKEAVSSGRSSGSSSCSSSRSSSLSCAPPGTSFSPSSARVSVNSTRSRSSSSKGSISHTPAPTTWYTDVTTKASSCLREQFLKAPIIQHVESPYTR